MTSNRPQPNVPHNSYAGQSRIYAGCLLINEIKDFHIFAPLSAAFMRCKSAAVAFSEPPTIYTVDPGQLAPKIHDLIDAVLDWADNGESVDAAVKRRPKILADADLALGRTANISL